MICSRPLILVALGLAQLSLFPGDLKAQYVNRAVYLGRDNEGIRRDFRQNMEYYLNRVSFMHEPWWVEDLNPFTNVLDYTVGSVTSSEFTIEGRFHLRQEVGKGFAVHLHELQSENQDARFLRTALEVDYEFMEDVLFFLQAEGTANKAEDDFSFGLQLGNRKDLGLRFMTTVVDLKSGKRDNSQLYIDKPYGLMLAGFVGGPRESQLVFELAGQLPTTLNEKDMQRDFKIERYIGRVEGRLRLGEADWLVSSLEAEFSGKERIPELALDPELERFRSDFALAQLEWWHHNEGGAEISVGGFFVHKNEDGYRENQINGTLSLEREEWFGFVRSQIPLKYDWTFNPQVYGGYVKKDELLGEGGATPTREDFEGFQGKLGLGFAYHFGPKATVILNPTFELDQVHFGGGNLQFRADF